VLLGHEAAGQPEQGVGGRHEPGPAVGLLGQPHAGLDPVEVLLEEAEAVLKDPDTLPLKQQR
jgi:hypothetical protein